MFGVILLIVGIGVWIGVFAHPPKVADTIACNDPAPSPPGTPPHPPLGDRIDHQALDSVTPSALSNTPVRVFNANGQSGQAGTVASELSDYGFQQAPGVHVANDPIYTQQNLQCQGQIRFGPGGRAQASAVWLLMPCAELIQDSRQDDTVDLALGSMFTELDPNADAQAVLKALRVTPGDQPPTPDADLVHGAHTTRCS